MFCLKIGYAKTSSLVIVGSFQGIRLPCRVFIQKSQLLVGLVTNLTKGSTARKHCDCREMSCWTLLNHHFQCFLWGNTQSPPGFMWHFTTSGQSSILTKAAKKCGSESKWSKWTQPSMWFQGKENNMNSIKIGKMCSNVKDKKRSMGKPGLFRWAKQFCIKPPIAD